MDILSKVNKLVEQKSEEKKVRDEKSSESSKQYPKINSLFLDAIVGTFEMRILADSNGEIHQDIRVRSVKNGAATSSYVLGHDAEMDARVENIFTQLNDKKYGNAFKFKPYVKTKLFIKTGKIMASNDKDLKPNTVYCAYVDPGYFEKILTTIKVQKDNGYATEEDLNQMFNPDLPSKGAFLINHTKEKKKTTHNLQYLPTIVIGAVNYEPLNVTKLDIKDVGFWRENDTRNKEKAKKAEDILNAILSSHNKYLSEKEAKKADNNPPAGTGQVNDSDNEPEIDYDNINQPSEEVSSGPSGAPSCFGDKSIFDVTSPKCNSQCAQWFPSCAQKCMTS